MKWPSKCNLFDVGVCATSHDKVLNCVMDAAQSGIPAIVTHLSVHGVVLAKRNSFLRSKIETFHPMFRFFNSDHINPDLGCSKQDLFAYQHRNTIQALHPNNSLKKCREYTISPR